MQSLDSSCQEADFIINDTLKKLKGDNPLNASSQGLPHAVGSAVQQQFVYQTSQGSQGSPQPQNQPQSYHQLHTVLQSTCSPTLAINNSQQQQQQQQQQQPQPQQVPAAPVPVSVRSLLQAIPQIPAQPPICIFDDDESPTELPTSGNIVILSEQPPASSATSAGLPCSGIAIAPSPSSCSSSTTTLPNLNSITSPSPVVPDLLLSTPPGVNSSLNSNNTSATSSHIFQHLQQQPQPHQQQQQSYSNTKKVDRRLPQSISSASSGITSSHNQQHHHHLQIHQPQSHNHQNVLSSPTSSPSKRSKGSSSNNNSKECSYSSRSTAPTSASPRAGAGAGSNTNTNNNASSTLSNSVNNKRESTTKFFNIHDKIKELYLQLLSNDLNHFAETGLKQRSRSFILDRLVECERLNTIVVNLYPGNKGYSLALHYDEQIMLNPLTNEWIVTDPTHIHGNHTIENSASTASRNKAHADSDASNNLFRMKSRLNESDAPPGDAASAPLSSGYGLVEVLRWPYENDLLLQCIDRELLPEFLMDLLSAETVTLSSPQDGSDGSRVYAKPSVFYAGCVIAQIRDFRQTFATSTNICDMKHILLRPSNATLFADVQQLGSSLGWAGSTPEDRLTIESQLVLATAEPLCLEPDPSIGRQSINAQHERQRFNSHEMRRQMKKFTQVAINRKRKLDQFTHHQGLELCDYLTRLRQRPRTSSNSTANATPATAPSNNPLVGAMLSSFTSKVPRRPHEVIRPIRPPTLDYPVKLKVPENVISVEKYAKTFEPLNEFSDACKEGCQANCRHNFQPQLIEEYVLETEREASEGRRALYHIKLSIFQRPSDAEYLGELYVDRDYREGERNGESCRFALGTRVHANRYIQQFREIFTEEGRKAVKITHLIPGHVPIVTHTGLTNEQRLLLQHSNDSLVNSHNSYPLQCIMSRKHIQTSLCLGNQQSLLRWRVCNKRFGSNSRRLPLLNSMQIAHCKSISSSLNSAVATTAFYSSQRNRNSNSNSSSSNNNTRIYNSSQPAAMHPPVLHIK
ncbi:PREDICTED: uncharacterized protein LOC108613682 isoform X3 [Drosophila arizonae]|uniref:Uncharacterized protein LOC108613682 isoform X3 n=1 Tax=Drosophila arizonae TaxID=7263 RepID=A0ABM1P6F2_DROAR|nr:PREDICTED: uncharacterized protein LOC108613682 isoform X3 [Drosophila arizonae]